ncbi:carbohydrate-binding protein [Spirosoma sp. KCTC 42546]|uniref:carbohydrate-binding protein n=1 Tax=Spirosoma sp. KCTC 42546 TaxID=2520506 RepID=UPI00115AEE3F|nr:carbohydrate-binding protein [Spirosoma sp. KCTC 42546]QDK82681.1 carbohydrate-binding protein [Spirosoma sp. KCTC 42546]
MNYGIAGHWGRFVRSTIQYPLSAGFLSLVMLLTVTVSVVVAQVPKNYKGKPFKDADYTKGAQLIPGRIELAYYDLGGEGIAYHDTDPINKGSGELNRKPDHQRPGVPEYLVHFREKEGVDLSFTKDFADFNHPNKVDPKVNQLYIGWQEDGEWTNYTVNVGVPGQYRIITVYGYQDNKSTLSVNNKKVVDLVFPENTGDYHRWTQATVGEITFPVAGPNLLTLHYNKGSNLAYLDFVLVKELPASK